MTMKNVRNGIVKKKETLLFVTIYFFYTWVMLQIVVKREGIRKEPKWYRFIKLTHKMYSQVSQKCRTLSGYLLKNCPVTYKL